MPGTPGTPTRTTRRTAWPLSGSGATPPVMPPAALSGAPDVIAAELRRYGEEGIAEVQLVLDPITGAAIDELAPVLEQLAWAARGGRIARAGGTNVTFDRHEA